MVNPLLKAPAGPPSDVEQIKERSDYLRGTLGEVMQDRISAGIPDDDNRLMKHHGSYLQDDRDHVMSVKNKNWSLPINLCCVSAWPAGLHSLLNGLLWMTLPRNTVTEP